MSMQRVSRIVKNPRTNENIFEVADSPVIIPHAAFVGLGISIPTGTVTVAVDAIKTGAFASTVTMLGTTFKYPDADGSNMLYHSAWVKLTFTGNIQIFQKG